MHSEAKALTPYQQMSIMAVPLLELRSPHLVNYCHCVKEEVSLAERVASCIVELFHHSGPQYGAMHVPILMLELLTFQCCARLTWTLIENIFKGIEEQLLVLILIFCCPKSFERGRD